MNGNSRYQVGSVGPPVPSPMVPTPQVRGGFMPMSSSNTGMQRSTSGHVQPPSPTPTQPAGPSAPPPTLQTADVSNVPGNYAFFLISKHLNSNFSIG